jgi:hypothetical protein
LQIPEDSGKYWLYQYCRYTGRFWKILVIPVLQILEYSGSCRMYLYIVFFCPVCASVMRGQTVYRETGRKEKRGGEKKE